jgi:hypothetical protein
MKGGKNKKDKFVDYYTNKIHIDKWLTNEPSNSIIIFKDRKEYKKFNKYHRLNGPAIDFSDETKDQYFYKGVFYDNKTEWEKATTKELRKIKLKKINKK